MAASYGDNGSPLSGGQGHSVQLPGGGTDQVYHPLPLREELTLLPLLIPPPHSSSLLHHSLHIRVLHGAQCDLLAPTHLFPALA
jgi:hypothetical protein